MSEEMIVIIVTSIIFLASLIVSLKNYLISKPKLYEMYGLTPEEIKLVEEY